MLMLEYILFVLSVGLTLDFMVDTIEAMSGKSVNHVTLGQTKPSLVYFIICVFFWAVYYIVLKNNFVCE